MVNNGTLNVTKGTLSVQVDETGTGTWNVANGADAEPRQRRPST